MKDNYKVLKIRYTFQKDDAFSSVVDLLIKNIYVIMKAQDGYGIDPIQKEKTLRQVKSELLINKYIEVPLFINDFSMVIDNSFKPLANTMQMDNVDPAMKALFVARGQAIGQTGELTRKMFDGTKRKEFRFDFFIQEDGDGRGLFNYLFLTLMGYPIGNLGWQDTVSLKYLANVMSTSAGNAIDGLSKALIKKTPLVGIGTSIAKSGLTYGILQNHTVFAVPNIDITVGDFYSSGGKDSRFLAVENVMVNGFNTTFVPEKVALVKPSFSKTVIDKESGEEREATFEEAITTENGIQTKPWYRLCVGQVSFTEKNITNYETFKSGFIGAKK